MKKLILLSLATIITAAAHAEKTVAVLQYKNPNIAAATLTDTGMLYFTKVGGLKSQVQLSTANTQLLMGQAQVLAGQELETEHNDVTCKIMIPPYYDKDLYVVDASGRMRLTLSSESCAYADHVFPKSETYKQIAESLKAELQVLANP